MRALAFLCALACAAYFAPVGVTAQSVCYFRLMESGTDATYTEETQMAADLWTNFLNIAHDDDARAIAIEGLPAQQTQIARVIASKIEQCHRDGKVILFNFHAIGDLLEWFHLKLLRYLFIALRGSALADAPQRAAARPILNLHSCFPQDYDADFPIVSVVINEVPLARRDEYGQWLYGARGSAANMLAWGTAVGLGGAGLGAIAGLRMAHGTLNQHCIVQGPRLPGGGYMPHEWVTNMLVRRHDDTGVEEGQILMHPRFHAVNNARTWAQKEKCYQGYNYQQTNTDRAAQTSDCVRGLVFGFANAPLLRGRVPSNGYSAPDWTKTIVANDVTNWLNNVPIAWTNANPGVNIGALPDGQRTRHARAALGVQFEHDSDQERINHPLNADPELASIAVAYPNLAGSVLNGRVFGARKRAINVIRTATTGAGRLRRGDLPPIGAMLTVHSRADADAAHAKVQARIAAIVERSSVGDDEEEDAADETDAEAEAEEEEDARDE